MSDADELARPAVEVEESASISDSLTVVKTETYTYDQVRQASIEYFKGDELAAEVFAGKYALQDKEGRYYELTPRDMHRRLAREFARIERKYPNPLTEDQIFAYLEDWRIVAQGSPMSGIGNPYQIQSLSNCFVIDPPADSYSGIFKHDEEQVQIMKRRGGVGGDISTIRPKGLPTSNAAKTTDGIGVFMERFSNSTREVAQGGRRGARMITLSVHHPEVETFINIKKDLKKVTGANISLRLSDEFMQAVADKKKYQLRFPVEPAAKHLVEQEVDAEKIWDQVVEAAWRVAEPGILFWDNIIKGSPADCYADVGFQTQSTNPCSPAHATLLTPSGIRTLGDINIGDTIWSGQRWTTVVNKVSTGVKPVYEYRTRAGMFIGTENHRIVQEGEKIEVGQAEAIDTAAGPAPGVGALDPQDIMDGLVLGDGSVHAASQNLVYLIVGDKDQDWLTSEVSGLITRARPGLKERSYEIKTTLTAAEVPLTYVRKVPARFEYGDATKVRSFLRGLYSANGSVVSNRVTLKASSIDVIESVQRMLSSLGISTYYTINKSHDVEFSNGTYTCRESYDLNISGDRRKFANLIGFIQKDKQERLIAACERPAKKTKKTTYDIVDRKYVGDMPVFDITVDAPEHTYWTGGLLVSNCGELPLTPYDSCRLILLNLFKFVLNPFTPSALFDWGAYHEAVTVAQRLMDDLVDLELEKIDEIIAKILADPEDDDTKSRELKLWQKIKETTAKGRRTGLGITSLGDTLAALGVKYGSDDAVQMTEDIYRAQAGSAYASSITLAKERGAFPIFSYEKEKDHGFLKKVITDIGMQEEWKTYGRRNIAVLTTSPAGSVSVETQTTSGIENVPFLSYTRRKKINPNDKTARIDFVDDLGDKWQEYKIFHHGLLKWAEINGKDPEKDVKDSPYWGTTIHDVNWLKKIEMQAAAQRWVDHSISNTTNVPADAQKELIGQIYMKAWELGCKGVTVYRDGSRSGVLVEKPKAQGRSSEQIPETAAPKRPLELPCDIHRTKIRGKEWVILVGTMGGRPYEIFAGEAKTIDLVTKEKTGKLVKVPHHGSATYDLHLSDEVYADVAKQFDNPEHGAFTRLLSTSLRHGVPIQFIVEQLRKDQHSDLTSFSKVIARVLSKSYVKDGTKPASEKRCVDCSSSNITYASGCVVCLDCGGSKCG